MAEQTKLRVAGEKAVSFVRAIGHQADLCLRQTNAKSTCQACMDICPGKAVRQPKDASAPSGTKVTVSKGFCVDCGLCCNVCPTTAMTVLEPSPRHLRHLLKRAQAAAGGSAHTVYITCIETGLAKEDASVIEIPCLGALTAETWTSLMLDFPNLAVYLPSDLCGRCKAKAAEMMIVDAVCAAQEIVGRDLTLVELRKELEFCDSKGKNLKASDEPFAEIGSGFGDIVRDIAKGEQDNMTEEERGNSDARKTRNRLRKEITRAEGEETPGLVGAEELTGTFTLSRATILDAAMRFPQIAPRVELKHVAVDAAKLGDVTADDLVAACPLGALHKTDEGALRVEPLVCVRCGLCKEIAPEAVTDAQTCLADLLLEMPAPAEEAVEA